ncbi:hypothetical protein PPACK8108_LOCUS21373 [Phakopsora pachyrhizi]|uniref:Uncharacterized protein n=1 Tax=Phakopsora pachyrhizi TaxID=170000 RepID=A0AAV0BHJ5_PHAPC|nr:hypothetical protein PPACK8108_LOCUS21373 [Phakopsora pachyrhizi]
MSSENKQLFSSEDEDTHPKKYFKTKAANNICHPSFLAGTSQQVWGIVNNPTQNKHLADSTHTNQDMFLNPTSNFSKEPLEVLGDDPFELLIQTLEAQLEIQPGQESFIRNLSQLSSSGKRHAATVYLLANIAQKMERFIEANSVSNIANLDSQSNTSHSVFGANNFVWTKPPKDFICIMLHQLLISTDVESYTKGTDSKSRKNLQNKPKEWKLKYLPKSFCTEENEAHSIILKNIIVQEGNPEQQIPRLIELAKLLLEWAAPKGTSYSNKQIKEKFRDKNIQRRFALLRVCAAYQHFCNHEAPWPKIDDELEKFKKKTSKYRNVYLSKKMASEIDFSMVVLPTDLQVEQELIKDSDSSQNNGFTSEE